MRRLSFSVVTGVTAALCAVGFVSRALRPSLPQPPTNAMADAPDPFLRDARFHQIRWRPLSSETLAESRRAGRPILLLVGTPASRLGRIMDEGAFADRQVASYLARHFTCLRVDGFAQPEWSNALLPVTRLQLGFLPDWQMWFLDPAGNVVGFLVRSDINENFDARILMQVLINARTRYERSLDRPNEQAPSAQRVDEQLLEQQTGAAAIPFSAYRSAILERIGATYGGFSSGGLRPLTPLAWRYLALTGEIGALRRAIDPLLTSPQYDPMDGGFYHVGRITPDGLRVELDKLTRENADAMHALALAGVLADEPVYRDFAEDTARFLGTARLQGWLAAARVGTEGPRQRSPRSSFGPLRLRRALPDEADRAWAETYLGLDISENPQALPFLTETWLKTAPSRRLSSVLVRLRGSAPPAVLAGARYSDVNLSAIARRIEVARIWGDQDRLQTASLDLDQAREVAIGADVRRQIGIEQAPIGYLGDYLAFADAMLQDYLATGRVPSFESGLRTLRRAQTLFAGKRPGEFVLATSLPGRAALPNSNMPEIADNLRESCTAQMIRLSLAYGRLVPPNEGLELLRPAFAAVNRFAAIATIDPVATAGYLGATTEAVDETYAVTVGPNAQEMADELFRAVPTRLIAPAFGPVRPDLQRRGPGIYVLNGTIQGPLTAEQAIRLLPRFRRTTR